MRACPASPVWPRWLTVGPGRDPPILRRWSKVYFVLWWLLSSVIWVNLFLALILEVQGPPACWVWRAQRAGLGWP